MHSKTQMTVSDIITIVSLIIAIIAIISEKNRNHLLLKFSWFDFVFYAMAFILINYFVFYNYFYLKGLYFKFLYFESIGLNHPKNYAYIISIICLITIFYKILYSFFPNRKRSKVIKYYISLIEKNDIQMLLDLLEKYHLKDIIKLVNSSKDYNPEDVDLFERRFRKVGKKEKILLILKILWTNINARSTINRHEYASSVLYGVINDPAFVSLAANIRPYLFAEIFFTFKKNKQHNFPDDLVNHYLLELIKEKNFWLRKELKQSDNFDVGQPEWFFDENKIIASLIQDVSVADVNNIWVPFGEEAIKEIENESNAGTNSKLFQKFRNDDLFWEYRTFFSVKFINVMVIEAIVQKYEGSNFHMQYYWIITEKILKNLSIEPVNKNIEVDSYYHQLIDKINNYLFHWLILSNEKESTGLFHDIIRCIGHQIYNFTFSLHFGEERTISFIERVLYYYCDLYVTANTDEIRTKIEEILLKPTILIDDHHAYYSYLPKAWRSFDKIPHRNPSSGEDYDYFQRLKDKVIIPLGLNPSEI